MRLMNALRRYIGEFRNIAADIDPVGVELLALERWVENPIARHAICPGRRTPLPIPIVGRQITVEQMMHEVPLSALPVDPKILDEKGRHDHADTVVHPSCLIELPHTGIHNRIARPPAAPGLEQDIPLRARVP